MSLLWDKSDARIDNDDLREINEWAEKHAKECELMNLIILGRGVMQYAVEYCSEFNEIDKVGYCPCGCRYYVGKGEEPPIGS